MICLLQDQSVSFSDSLTTTDNHSYDGLLLLTTNVFFLYHNHQCCCREVMRASVCLVHGGNGVDIVLMRCLCLIIPSKPNEERNEGRNGLQSMSDCMKEFPAPLMQESQ